MQIGDLATWVGSIGVTATLAATVWQLHHERSIRRQEEKRSQAVKVAAWYGGDRSTEGVFVDSSTIMITNSSDTPVYSVIVGLVFVQGAGPQSLEDATASAGSNLYTVVGALGPGTWTVRVANDWHGMSAHVGAEIAFSDARGNHWVRRANGALDELPRGAIDNYGIDRPVTYSEPGPA